MALHDLWHFENAPVGQNLVSTLWSSSVAYTGSGGLYNQNTGLPGMLTYQGTTANTWAVSADGFLVNTANASGAAGSLFIATASVMDFTTPTQYWFGFRTKLVAGTPSATANFLIVSNTAGYGTWSSLLSETQLINAGLAVIGVEHFVECFINRTALTFQVYVDGLLVNSGSLTSTTFSSTSFLTFGAANGSAGANMARGFRDFYFLDVDASTPGRLGSIRAKATTTAAANGSEWTPNGAADLVTALNTANANPPVVTPYVQAPTDNQPLALTMATNIAAAGNKIIAVQPSLSYQSSGAGVVKVNASLQDSASNTTALGQFVNGGGLQLNQRLPFATMAPDGSSWTPAKINQSQFVLTPTS
jgi:hypothetical protein